MKLNTGLVTALLLTAAAAAQTPPPTAAEPPASSAPSTVSDLTESPVNVDVFYGPQRKRVDPPSYPLRERSSGRDGWVSLNFMVDPQGKPYEITVLESTGNKALEKAAIEAAEKWEFEPATLGGMPVDAGYAIKVKFLLTGDAAASLGFAEAYKSSLRAIKSQDRPKADESMAKMKVQNLYEDAFFSLAQFQYARQWGTEYQQLAAIKRAIADEDDADYLPKATFRASLEILLHLQIKSNDFAGALTTWGKLRKLADPEILARWERRIGEIEAFRVDPRPYTVAGDFEDSSYWEFQLFRNRFHVAVSSGRVSEIKLRCDKKYVFFKYQPDVQYTISDKYGACGMELIGDPGTKIKLVQS